MKFNNYEWHNAILKKLNIDRSNPGYHDTISVNIEWPDKTTSTLVFENVYKVIIELNIGSVGDKTILAASIVPDNDEDLVKLRNTWRDFKIGHVDCYVFQTYTGSNIKIIAKKFIVL